MSSRGSSPTSPRGRTTGFNLRLPVLLLFSAKLLLETPATNAKCSHSERAAREESLQQFLRKPLWLCCQHEVASSRESHGHQELSRVNKVARGICFSFEPQSKRAPFGYPLFTR